MWNWNGARWWKCDFHTHTPASDDYGKGPDQAALKQRSPRDWLLDYMRAEVDCIVITDHNSGDWIDRLYEELSSLDASRPKDYRPVFLFPGIELSVNGGIHVLGILDPSKRTEDINALLGAVEFPLEKKGTGDATTAASFQQVVERVVKAGGIAIPAHVDSDSGLFTEGGVTLAQFLKCEQLSALEVVDYTREKPPLYVDGKYQFAEVLGSDSHHPTGPHCPGSHFTWIKMGTPTLEGLRLALLDGALSIRRSDKEPANPNTHAPHVIEELQITNARYLGRPNTFSLSLNPWLNAVIGGRGTGKSTLVEFLRLVLRREQEVPAELVNDFRKYGEVYHHRDDEGLLAEGAVLAAVYRKDDTRYRINWQTPTAEASIEEEVAPGEWRVAEGDVAQRFPVRIYSQKQVFQLAKTPSALLRIIDEAGDVDRSEWLKQWREKESEYLALRANIRQQTAALDEEPKLKGELEDIKRKLQVFEQAGHAAVLKAYQSRALQSRAVGSWEEEWQELKTDVRRLAKQGAPPTLDSATFDLTANADKEIHELAGKTRKNISNICAKLLDLAKDLDDVEAEWSKSRDTSQWAAAVKSATADYQALLNRLKAEGAGDPSEYGHLVDRRQAIEGRLKECDSRRAACEDLDRQAAELLSELFAMRKALSRKRAEFLSRVLRDNPYVQIELVPYGDRESVEAELRTLLHRDTGFEKDIGNVDGEGLLGPLYQDNPDDATFEGRLAELRSQLAKIARGEHTPEDLRDQRFSAHLEKLPPESFDRLALWYPDDSLAVRYSPTADGKNLRSIHEGSPGQKTAALLAFLLSYGEEPIILDQPEDDLDNTLIYDLIVQQLRAFKTRRQVLVVTHNANIVVNGDAELVLALVARGGQSQKGCEGPMQDQNVRRSICEVMEGGRDAFIQRYRRIALE